MQHLLKTKEPKFTLLYNGMSDTELRPNDRFFNVGDTVHLAAYSSEHGFSGHYVNAEINWIITHDQASYIPEGFILFGITNCVNYYDDDLRQNG